MGVMRFLVHSSELPEGWPEVYRAYMSGADGSVFPTRVEVDGNVVACRRNSSESGKLHVSWPVEGFGRPLMTTSSLPEREQPYLLAVELARGKICQIRDQLSAWEMAGMKVPGKFQTLHKQSHRLFARSVAIQQTPEAASALASEALVKACQAAEIIAQEYTRQRLLFRRQKSPQLPASLGCCLGYCVPEKSWDESFCEAFNAAAVAIKWRLVEPVEGEYHWDIYDEQIEWCEKNRLLISGGPLLDLSAEGMPPWLWQWERDVPNLQSFVCDFVETAISRYVGKVRHWEVSARVNTGGALALNEENRLTLVARTLEIAAQVDEENHLVVCIDQPWGDYQARGEHLLSPLHFIDTLVRSGVGLSGVNLEIGVGYGFRSSASRDLLAFSRLIDVWSLLGIPLHVTLAFPSSNGADDNAAADIQVESETWKGPWSEAAQAEWVDLYLPLLLAKESIIGINWAHFSDRSPHHFPNAGLLAVDGRPKPALQRIINHRQEYCSSNDRDGISDTTRS